MLNDDVAAIPINWYRGDYAYDQERVTNFGQTNFGLILWEQVTVSGVRPVPCVVVEGALAPLHNRRGS